MQCGQQFNLTTLNSGSLEADQGYNTMHATIRERACIILFSRWFDLHAPVKLDYLERIESIRRLACNYKTPQQIRFK